MINQGNKVIYNPMCSSSNICTKISGVWHHYMVILSVMLSQKMNQLMNKLYVSHPGTKVPKRESLFPNRASPLFSSSRTGITDYEKKMPILNLNNFFSRHFKKILNGQKFINLFIYKLPKFGENPSKTVIHFFRFLSVL